LICAQFNANTGEQPERKAAMKTKTVKRQWLSYQEAMDYCGLGRTLLTQLVTSGEIVAAKIGKRVLINHESLESYLESRSYSEVVRP
jgi:excisionase family DNA binding protein